METKPRNPLVVAAKFRRAGVHEKTIKAKRRAERMALQKQLNRAGNKPDRDFSSCLCR